MEKIQTAIQELISELKALKQTKVLMPSLNAIDDCINLAYAKIEMESKQKVYSEEDLRKAFAIGMDYYAEPNVWDEVTPKQKFENLLNKSE